MEIGDIVKVKGTDLKMTICAIEGIHQHYPICCIWKAGNNDTKHKWFDEDVIELVKEE